MVHVVAAGAEAIAKHTHARDGANAAIKILAQASDLHTAIAKGGIVSKDETNAYQVPWSKALQRALTNAPTITNGLPTSVADTYQPNPLTPTYLFLVTSNRLWADSGR